MVGTLAAKKGIWEGVWSRAMGVDEEDDDYEMGENDKDEPDVAMAEEIPLSARTVT
jgi:protoheme IX farnesyltransferase